MITAALVEHTSFPTFLEEMETHKIDDVLLNGIIVTWKTGK